MHELVSMARDGQNVADAITQSETYTPWPECCKSYQSETCTFQSKWHNGPLLTWLVTVCHQIESDVGSCVDHSGGSGDQKWDCLFCSQLHSLLWNMVLWLLPQILINHDCYAKFWQTVAVTPYSEDLMNQDCCPIFWWTMTVTPYFDKPWLLPHILMNHDCYPKLWRTMTVTPNSDEPWLLPQTLTNHDCNPHFDEPWLLPHTLMNHDCYPKFWWTTPFSFSPAEELCDGVFWWFCWHAWN